jgi:hypothetical protein
MSDNLVGTSLSISGISTIANFLMTPVGTGATVGGIGVTYYGDGSQLININSSSLVGVVTYADRAGIATYADRAGIATNVIGGIASVTSLNVTGITTLASIVGTSLSITGISTLGITSTTNLTTQQLLVTGITTLASIVGTSLSISGISTISNLTITNIGTGATVGGIGVVTYYGDGSNLSGVSAFSVQQQEITSSPIYPTFANGVGVSSIGIVPTEVAYIPASGNLGIGTTTPTSKLTVQGDVLVSGVLTAANLVGTALSISGISTIANFRMSPVGTGATVGGIGVTYYGDGSQLTNIVTSIVAGTNVSISSSIGQVTINSSSSGGGSISISTNTTNQSQFIPYATSIGTTTGFGVTTGGLVFNPSTTRLGIGTTNPISNLDVRGDVSIASTLGIGTVIDIIPYDTLNSGTLSWEGSAGQLFSITNNLTTGSIYSVNDVSGIPSIDVDANGTIQLGPYGGNIGLGTTNPTSKLHVVGDVRITGVSTFGGLVELDAGLRDINNTVGVAGSVLVSTGAGVSWTAPAAGTKTYTVFTPDDNQPPAANFATLDTRNSILVLDFDAATDESAVFVGVIPESASLGSGLKIRLHWMATTATSGNCIWDVSLERMTTDLDSDSFDTIASATTATSGTSGIITVTEITLTTIDSVTAGDGFRLKVTRDANNASDTMTGDAELVVVEVRSAA